MVKKTCLLLCYDICEKASTIANIASIAYSKIDKSSTYIEVKDFCSAI